MQLATPDDQVYSFSPLAVGCAVLSLLQIQIMPSYPIWSITQGYPGGDIFTRSPCGQP